MRPVVRSSFDFLPLLQRTLVVGAVLLAASPAIEASSGHIPDPEPLPERQVIAGPSVFSNPDISWSSEIGRYIELYSGPAGLNYISRSLRAGLPYRDFIVQQLEARRMPRELYYLALIESNFDATAVSRSGAVGLWQFMENSVEEWMVINAEVDERRDFYRSTHAALEKLSWNFTVLEDWLLAIAAYNAGLGHVRRAIESAGTRDYWRLAGAGLLPDQTVDYVPKFLAIAWIAEHGGRYGLPCYWLEPLEWTRVEAPGGVELATIAELAGIPTDTLHSWNLHLNKRRTPVGAVTYPLNVPLRSHDRLESAVDIVSLTDTLIERSQSADSTH